jgi:hypothetical protein
MSKYHIKENGSPAICRAKKGNCPRGSEANHYPTKEAAQGAFELSNQYRELQIKNHIVDE